MTDKYLRPIPINNPKYSLEENDLRTVKLKMMRQNLVGDVISAFSVSFCVAPFLTVVDKAIVQRAAGSHSIMRSTIESISSMAKNPVAYLRSPMFLMMWGVYGCTYATANSMKTLLEHKNFLLKEERKKSDSYDKIKIFATTTLVNSGTTLMKDRAYAKMFGTTASNSLPMISYGLWGLRDCLVISSSFILPDLLCNKLRETTNMTKNEAKGFSQLFCPIVTQFVAGPIQLLGLDFYNRPMQDRTWIQSTRDRITLISRNYGSIVTARIARIAPAYGIGGIGNTFLRDSWREAMKSNTRLNFEKSLSGKSILH